jgi:hypothetical protein
VPHAQNCDDGARYFIANLVTADEQTPDFARRVSLDPFAQPGMLKQAVRSTDERADKPYCGSGVTFCEELMEAADIGQRVIGPFKFHRLERGTGNGFFVPRLFAQAWTRS